MTEGELRLGRRKIRFEVGDTVASALYRAGVRTLSRSVKYHRRRGLYCGTGDCPNCLLTVDGVPGVRSCVTPARGGMRVRREGGWPSVDRDLLSVLDRLHALLPVGFYYKTFVRPRWMWPLAERAIRRTVGLGRLPTGRVAEAVARHVRCDLLVVGAGTSGRATARSAVARGERVVICDEGAVDDGPAGAEILERHAAIGIYEGPMVPLAAGDELVQVHPRRIVVATGALQAHPVFPGNDLPGVMLGRAAAGLVARGVEPGRRVVVVAAVEEGLDHVEVLRSAEVRVAALVVPAGLADRVPEGIRTLVDAEILRAEGKDRVRFAILREADGTTRGIGCDAFVISHGLWPRDEVLRTAAAGEPVQVVGDAAIAASPTGIGESGYVCLCEDVTVDDLGRAWDEGYRSSELLKRYTTATMGPCQGAMCGRYLAATVHEVIERRTSLHETHIDAGARIGRSGPWLRPFSYGDPLEEYRAVRERVSLMDVGTLGKFLVAGPEATRLVDQAFPTRVRDLAPGRARYLLALDEAGYVFDDGLLCSLGGEGWYITSTSGGSDGMEAWLKDRADRLGLRAHVVDLTAERGAIVVAGPFARDVLARLTGDPIDPAAFPHLGVRELTVAGVPCGAIRTGFVGELAFELHHPRSHGPELWRAVVDAGAAVDIRPHGLDVLELLRLEKGHLFVGQDTLPDDTPDKLGLGETVDMTKERFPGKHALRRLAAVPVARRLVGLEFDRGGADLRGLPLIADGRIVGRVTSAARSPILGRTIGLGWVCRAPDGGFPGELRADGALARVVPTPFYDPEGDRLRA